MLATGRTEVRPVEVVASVQQEWENDVYTEMAHLRWLEDYYTKLAPELRAQLEKES